MIRMTFLLAFCIWLVFVLGPEPAPPEPQAVAGTEAAEATASAEGRSVTLETGEVWQIDRVISPGPQSAEPVGAEPVVAARGRGGRSSRSP